MKIIFLASTYGLIYIIRYKYRHTYDKEHDTFRIEFIIIPCAVLALLFNIAFEFAEVLWSDCSLINTKLILFRFFGHSLST